MRSLLFLSLLLLGCDDAILKRPKPAPTPQAAPTLAVDPALDFGEVIVGRTKTAAVHLTTSGGAMAVAVTVSGPGQKAYAVANELRVDGEGSLDVSFTPHRAGTLTASLEIGEQIVALTGVGVDACGPRTQRFTAQAAAAPKLDVLFVIDDSPSMQIGQAAIRQQIGVFVSRLATQGVDYRMAVVTTSMNIDWAAATLVLAADQKTKIAEGANALADFQAILERVTTGGSDTELGLLATIVALTPPDRLVAYDVTSGVSASYQGFGKRDPAFWRDDARLAVILVSDENDGGSPVSPDKRSPAVYAADLVALKPHATTDLRVAVITDPGSTTKGCATTAATGGAPRYHAFVSALGSTIATAFDYCSNFGTSLSVAGSFVAAPTCHFALNEPVPANAQLCNASGCLSAGDWSLQGDSVEILRGCPTPGEWVELRYESCL